MARSQAITKATSVPLLPSVLSLPSAVLPLAGALPLAGVPLERSVLVVEADPDVQVQVARALRSQGHRVVGTSSGDGALALITEWAVDLVLVSQDLPRRTGVEVTRLLRERRPNVPVLLMVSGTEGSIREAARLAGAAGCVTKPLALESLDFWLGPPTIPRLRELSIGASVAE